MSSILVHERGNMTFQEKIQNIIALLTSALEDAEKFDEGNDAAGKRLRHTCQQSKVSLQDMRNAIQTERNSRKVTK